jgi:hypothetical protein
LFPYPTPAGHGNKSRDKDRDNTRDNSVVSERPTVLATSAGASVVYTGGRPLDNVSALPAADQ